MEENLKKQKFWFFNHWGGEVRLVQNIDSEVKTINFSKFWFTVSNTRPVSLMGNLLNHHLIERIVIECSSEQTKHLKSCKTCLSKDCMEMYREKNSNIPYWERNMR